MYKTEKEKEICALLSSRPLFGLVFYITTTSTTVRDLAFKTTFKPAAGSNEILLLTLALCGPLFRLLGTISDVVVVIAERPPFNMNYLTSFATCQAFT